MISALRVGLILAAGVALGWTAHAWLPGPASPRASASSAPSRAAAAPPPVVHCDGVTLAEMRALLDEKRVQDLPAATVPPPPSPSPATVAALAELQAAMSDGTWSSADAALLRQHLVDLDPEQADGFVANLAAAVNDGRLRLEGGLF